MKHEIIQAIREGARDTTPKGCSSDPVSNSRTITLEGSNNFVAGGDIHIHISPVQKAAKHVSSKEIFSSEDAAALSRYIREHLTTGQSSE